VAAAAILLAAGESKRMGRPKALLPWAGTTLLDYQVRQVAEAGCGEIVVVLGHDARSMMAIVGDDVRPHVSATVHPVINEEYREGRASSLRTGAKALREDAGPIVVLSVDQPRPAQITSTLLAASEASGKDVTLPLTDGRHGHPAVVSNALLAELRVVTEETHGLRGVIAAHRDSVHEVQFELYAHESAMGEPDFNALFVHVDINTPEDYEGALELLKLTGGG
jgi:CTP:molybdopterin cytidylyltransferase MocA